MSTTDPHSHLPSRIARYSVQVSRKSIAQWCNPISLPTTIPQCGKTVLLFYLQFQKKRVLSSSLAIWKIDQLPAWSAFKQQRIDAMIQGGLSILSEMYDARWSFKKTYVARSRVMVVLNPSVWVSLNQIRLLKRLGRFWSKLTLGNIDQNSGLRAVISSWLKIKALAGLWWPLRILELDWERKCSSNHA